MKNDHILKELAFAFIRKGMEDAGFDWNRTVSGHEEKEYMKEHPGYHPRRLSLGYYLLRFKRLFS